MGNTSIMIIFRMKYLFNLKICIIVGETIIQQNGFMKIDLKENFNFLYNNLHYFQKNISFINISI